MALPSNTAVLVTVNSTAGIPNAMPVKSVTVNLEAQGSGSTAIIETSFTYAKKVLGSDFVQIGRLGSVLINVRIGDTQVFSGFLDSSTIHLERGTVTLNCRDFTCILQEGTANVLIRTDQTVQNFLNQVIAPYNSLLPTNQQITFNVGNPTDKVGTFFNNKFGVLNRGHTAWQAIHKIALDNGFVVFMDRQNVLFINDFAKANPPSLTNTVGMSYGGQSTVYATQGANFSSTIAPVRIDRLTSLEVVHNARRNGTFHVQTYSHTPNDGKTTVGSATVVAPGFSIVGTNAAAAPVNPGLYTGRTTVPAVQARLGGGVPIYDFKVEALTQLNAQKDARGRALDIAQHELMLTGVVPGDVSLDQYTYVNVSGTGVGAVDSTTFRLASISHIYSVGDGGSSEGFSTRWTGWKVAPPEIAGTV